MDVMEKKVKPKAVGAVDIDAAIEESEREIANGAELMDIDEVFAFLRRKFFDEV